MGSLITSICCICFFLAASPSFVSPSVLFQGFTWSSWQKQGGLYNFLKTSVPDLAKAGVTLVWLPPSSKSGSDAPQGYKPQKLYDLNSNYGTEAELRSLIEAFRQNQIKPIADIVINHRSPVRQSDTDIFFEGGTPVDRLDWSGTKFVCSTDKNFPHGTGSPDTGEDFPEAIDIDHTNQQVQTQLSDWLNWLKTEVGFEGGWRIDYAVGFSANIMKNYVSKTSPSVAIAEYWHPPCNERLAAGDNRKRDELRKWVMEDAGGVVSAFDFPLKEILQIAVTGEFSRLNNTDGKPPGLLGVLPEKAVTFIDNHDTGPQEFCPFPSEKVTLGYVYILTHPGIPTIFYDHFYEWGLKEPITQVSMVRKKHGINESSSVRILAAKDDHYVAEIDSKIIMKIGPNGDLGNLIPSDFKLALSGKDYAIWEKPWLHHI